MKRLTPLGEHEEGQEGEVLVGDEPAGCAVKGESSAMVPGVQGLEVCLIHRNDGHELQAARRTAPLSATLTLTASEPTEQHES